MAVTMKDVAAPDGPLPETRIVLPASLAVRESCGGQPLDAPWRNSATLIRGSLFAEENPGPVKFNPTGVPGPVSVYPPTGTPPHN